jgi:hypothetical protein
MLAQFGEGATEMLCRVIYYSQDNKIHSHARQKYEQKIAAWTEIWKQFAKRHDTEP